MVKIYKQQFEVEKILQMKMINKKPFYYIKWLGWDKPEDNTWEPIEHLRSCKDLMKKFTEERESKKKIKEKQHPNLIQKYKIKPTPKSNLSQKTKNSQTNRTSRSKVQFQEQKQDQVENEEGSFQLKDIPDKIIKVKIINNEMLIEVQWKKRSDGYQPLNSFNKSSEFRESVEGMKILLDYYESKINTQTTKQGSR